MARPPSKMERKELLLPTEIIVKILSRLPTMSALRFHCVSKQWFNILREEYFRDLHSEVLLRSESPLPKILFCAVQIQKQKQHIIAFSSPGATSLHTIKFFSHTDNDVANYMRRPVAHCNGLLCMIPYKRLMERSIIVCNPLTLEHLALPLRTTTNVFESSFGLGFAPLSNQYKVVCIYLVNASSEPSNFSSVKEQMMEVCTLGDTTWRVVNPQVDLERWCCQAAGLYADGKIYWVICGPHPHKICLLSLDVESEQAIVIENLPPIANSDCLKLAQLGSGVSLFVTRGSELEIWTPKNYCSSDNNNYLWDIRHRIRLPELAVGAGGLRSIMWWTQGMWKFGDGDLLIVLDDSYNKRFCCGRISSTQRDHGQFSVDYSYENRSFWSPCSGYKPSLISLKRYRCSMGEIVVDDGFNSPPNIQIQQLLTTM